MWGSGETLDTGKPVAAAWLWYEWRVAQSGRTGGATHRTTWALAPLFAYFSYE
jgi:hypothetical protein